MSKVTVRDLQARKAAGEKLVVVTAYDHATASLVDAAGVDAVLVGDSLGMVVQGHESTLPVTLEHMLYHTACVARARPKAQIVADLPFGTFQRGPEVTLESSIRLVQESGAEAVKIEGAEDRLRCIEAVVRADIPVWGHVGLTPQSVHAFGGYRVQGREADAARRVLDDARRVEAAGAALIVLECIPFDLAEEITATLDIPTIGIGAGPHCDGQVLVFHDVLGFSDEFSPKFVRRYAHVAHSVPEALRQFSEDVRAGRFPSIEESYRGMADATSRRGAGGESESDPQ